MRPRATISSRCSNSANAADRPAKPQSTNGTMLSIPRTYADAILRCIVHATASTHRPRPATLARQQSRGAVSSFALTIHSFVARPNKQQAACSLQRYFTGALASGVRSARPRPRWVSLPNVLTDFVAIFA